MMRASPSSDAGVDPAPNHPRPGRTSFCRIDATLLWYDAGKARGRTIRICDGPPDLPGVASQRAAPSGAPARRPAGLTGQRPYRSHCWRWPGPWRSRRLPNSPGRLANPSARAGQHAKARVGSQRQHARDRGRTVALASLYRFPRFSRRSRALLSAFRRGLRRMLASDLVRALANRCLRDIFFVRRSNVWPPSIGKTMCVLPTKTRQCSARPHDASIEANALPCLGQRLDRAHRWRQALENWARMADGVPPTVIRKITYCRWPIVLAMRSAWAFSGPRPRQDLSFGPLKCGEGPGITSPGAFHFLRFAFARFSTVGFDHEPANQTGDHRTWGHGADPAWGRGADAVAFLMHAPAMAQIAWRNSCPPKQ